MVTQFKDLIEKIYSAFNARDKAGWDYRNYCLQVERDLNVNLIFDGNVKHMYTLEDALLIRMDIEPE